MDNKIIMDTNVAAKAATPLTECKDEELDVQQKCMRFIKNFVDNSESKLVLDADYQIIKEYRNRISMKTDMGRIFWRWFNKYISCILFDDYLKLDKDSEGNYVKFPLEERTKDFDFSDRKFVALSRTHSEHPTIVEATDGKWFGFKEIFEEYGVHIEFLDRDYAEMMYNRKILNKGKD
ncbi:MAG: hypothetical protein Q4C91_17775 [Eubacteriales bacterium]|nr:hypothetical protein [Eubacteriales bacterium]